MPQLSTDVGTAVEQLITLLTQQKNALATQANQIEELAQAQHSTFFDVKQIHSLMDRVSKAELFARKLSERVDERGADEDLADTLEFLQETLKRVDAAVVRSNADLLLFWRMTLLERLAWLFGGARVFQYAARLRVWWRQRWQR